MSGRLDLAVVHAVCAPLPEPGADGAEQLLIALAATWASRLAAGHDDRLILLGLGFEDEAEFRARLLPYKLEDAEVIVVEVDSDGNPDRDPLDFDEVREDLEHKLRIWLSRRLPTVVPVIAVPKVLGAVDYGNEPWWLGLISQPDADDAPAVQRLKALLDPPFAHSAPTWLAVLQQVVPQCVSGSERGSFEWRLAEATFARWCSGFLSAMDDGFSFEYAAAEAIAEVSPFWLGLEAAADHHDEVQEAWFDGGESEAASAAFRALLRDERYMELAALHEFFGNSAALFYTMYTSRISLLDLRLEQPMHQQYSNVLNCELGDAGELEAAWRFVHKGDWSAVDDHDW